MCGRLDCGLMDELIDKTFYAEDANPPENRTDWDEECEPSYEGGIEI